MATSRKQPQQERSRETVAVLLEAAAQVFERDGYSATTTNRIAARAGVSIGSLYQYFPNKEALVAALAEQYLHDAEARVSATFHRLAEERSTLETLLWELVRFIVDARRPDLFRELFERSPRTPELLALLRDTQRRTARRLTGELWRVGVVMDDPDATSLLIVQGMSAQVAGSVLPASDAERDTRVRQVVDLWMRALS
ncbi:TetR/AcrR family transcriptional regulator [Spiractinospora alimapuensis]|uniref:TetR/AcrR family transcriptional regulator n=1 Tax=Spiractinospora alimapuensis TaxID=2820884 RepID=UPI001F2C5E80|nr:TetR/AcrR family transcriptional regulator [Spiractinospora alimapuensis]QVQ50183.1 TetR/AcrR family transcriptional regulator [Spiractinospora alimapuensis]